MRAHRTVLGEVVGSGLEISVFGEWIKVKMINVPQMSERCSRNDRQ